MIEKKLEKKLEKFLKKNGRQYYEGSISYQGVRNTKMIDGNFKDLHIVDFTVSISDQPYDGDGYYFATFEVDTEKLFEIIGPQSYEKIEE